MLTHITPAVTYLKDYLPPSYRIESVDMTFELGEEVTTVTARSKVVRQQSTPLVLSGEQLELVSIKVNNQALTPAEYQLTAELLTLPNVPEEFVLEIVTRIHPQANTALSGLFVSNHIFCTQCEAEGFRRITYFLDRPDVMARYTTTIIADKTRYPVLLSNGNPSNQKDLPDNRHCVTWQDPFKKPSYLFALVAGNLDCLEDQFVTRSGRSVALRIFVEKGQLDKVQHAMHSLKEVMRWDEVAYGREYDLDIFMIVAINDFNMGAMENKGLNIFNAKYILAKPETATDGDFEGVLVVVGHEYLHNWSGDRVTCRDWFQLSLKEGLTVFREQEFTADMTSALVSRIATVRTLRNSQFREDAGPLAHPVQPDSYIEINNFYTYTVYNKGAEVIRMIKVLLGPEKFRQGMDLYFQRHDGCAVTIEDFVKAMEDASKRDLTQFRLWYHQAGTPELAITTHYDAVAKTYTLKVKQSCPPTPNQPLKKPFHIPFSIGLLDNKGQDMALQLAGEDQAAATTSRIFEIKNPEETFQLVNVAEKPVPSLLRNFSAPVKLRYDYNDQELQFLLAHDSDGFNRWESGQKIAIKLLMQLITSQQQPTQLPAELITTFHHVLTDALSDKAFLAELLILPSETYLGEQMKVVDVDAIHRARDFVRRELARHLRADFLAAYQHNISQDSHSLELQAIGQRRFKNTCLNYLMLLNDAETRSLCLKQFQQATNMTDQLSALVAFANADCPERESVLSDFYNQWQRDPLVIDKWFAIQACSELPGALTRVKALLKHPAFEIKNPNNVRALIGAFCNENLVQFHAKNGEGYKFLTEQVLLLDKLNPQIAARLLQPFTYCHRYDNARQALMRKQLELIAGTEKISKDVYEVASKSLKV